MIEDFTLTQKNASHLINTIIGLLVKLLEYNYYFYKLLFIYNNNNNKALLIVNDALKNSVVKL